jgi:hypothetical protein
MASRWQAAEMSEPELRGVGKCHIQNFDIMRTIYSKIWIVMQKAPEHMLAISLI